MIYFACAGRVIFMKMDKMKGFRTRPSRQKAELAEQLPKILGL